MFAASIKPERSLPRIWYWRALPVLSMSTLLPPKVTMLNSHSSSDNHKLVDIKEVSKDTTLCLAAAHALVKLDDGTIVGDPMEKTTLDALEWVVGTADSVQPASKDAPHATRLTIRRRFAFSSALKRMSSVSSLPGGELLAAVKGAPETIKTMLATVPADYDETYKWYTRRGSRVLALASKSMPALNTEKVIVAYMWNSAISNLTALLRSTS